MKNTNYEQKDKNGFFISSDVPAWIDRDSISKFKDANFRKIIDFFIFLNPCKDLCTRADFSVFYKWSAPWKKPYKLNKQLKHNSTNYKLLFSAKTYGDIENALEKANLKDNFPNDITSERICFYNNHKAQFMSVFYHIRNSFAHSRFCIKEDGDDWIFVFEDVVGKKVKKVSARIILKKSTLLKWIEIIEGGEKALSEQKQ